MKEHSPPEEFSFLFPAPKTGMPEGAYDSVYVVQNGRFRFVNPQFAAAGGFTEKDMLGMESARIIHPDDQQEARQNAIKMLKGLSTLPYTFRIIAKDGSVKWIQ